jgi:hypothetical protein
MVKPPPTDKVHKPKLEEEVDKIVNKGAPVKEDVKKEEKKEKEDKWKLVPIRMPEKLLKELDDKIKNRIGLSRNAWILESIQKNLKE